jgi:hypothetical protein
MMGRVIKVEMIFLYQLRMGVGRFEEGSLRRWCSFNTSVSAQEGRRRDKALLKDEVEAANSS